MKKTGFAGFNGKRTLAIIAAAGILSVGVAAYAADARTPAEIAADLTGKTLEEVQSERAEGKTYGTIAAESGQLEAFREDMLESRKALLDQRVAEGRLTREQADEIWQAMLAAEENCDGTGEARIGSTYGLGVGGGMGLRNGGGTGRGAGFGLRDGSGRGAGLAGRGMWSGDGLRDGTCPGCGLISDFDD